MKHFKIPSLLDCIGCWSKETEKIECEAIEIVFMLFSERDKYSSPLIESKGFDVLTQNLTSNMKQSPLSDADEHHIYYNSCPWKCIQQIDCNPHTRKNCFYIVCY